MGDIILLELWNLIPRGLLYYIVNHADFFYIMHQKFRTVYSTKTSASIAPEVFWRYNIANRSRKKK